VIVFSICKDFVTYVVFCPTVEHYIDIRELIKGQRQMNYPLNIHQQKIVAQYAKKKWYGGDDNDFSGFLGNIVLDVFASGDKRLAYQISMHNPMALELTTPTAKARGILPESD
jgi:hypothetical protein